MQITYSHYLYLAKAKGVSYTPGECMNCDSFLYLIILNKLLRNGLLLGVDVFNWINSRCAGRRGLSGKLLGRWCTFNLFNTFYQFNSRAAL